MSFLSPIVQVIKSLVKNCRNTTKGKEKYREERGSEEEPKKRKKLKINLLTQEKCKIGVFVELTNLSSFSPIAQVFKCLVKYDRNTSKEWDRLVAIITITWMNQDTHSVSL